MKRGGARGYTASSPHCPLRGSQAQPFYVCQVVRCRSRNPVSLKLTLTCGGTRGQRAPHRASTSTGLIGGVPLPFDLVAGPSRRAVGHSRRDFKTRDPCERRGRLRSFGGPDPKAEKSAPRKTGLPEIDPRGQTPSHPAPAPTPAGNGNSFRESSGIPKPGGTQTLDPSNGGVPGALGGDGCRRRIRDSLRPRRGGHRSPSSSRAAVLGTPGFRKLPRTRGAPVPFRPSHGVRLARHGVQTRRRVHDGG